MLAFPQSHGIWPKDSDLANAVFHRAQMGRAVSRIGPRSDLTTVSGHLDIDIVNESLSQYQLGRKVVFNVNVLARVGKARAQ